MMLILKEAALLLFPPPCSRNVHVIRLRLLISSRDNLEHFGPFNIVQELKGWIRLTNRKDRERRN